MAEMAYIIVNELTWTRKHRTMFVVRMNNPSGQYAERLQRFIDSLNRTDTIKADVFADIDGDLFYLQTSESAIYLDELATKRANNITRSKESLKNFARDKGYVQICTLESCHDEGS